MRQDKPDRLFFKLIPIGIFTLFFFLLSIAQAQALTLDVGKEPSGVAIDRPSNRAFITNREDNAVSVVDLSDNSLLATIPVGEHPGGIAVNSQTNRAVVVNKNSDSVSIIDLATSTVTATVPVGKDPFGVSINPYTNTAAISNSKSDTVTIMGSKRGQIYFLVESGVLIV